MGESPWWSGPPFQGCTTPGCVIASTCARSWISFTDGHHRFPERWSFYGLIAPGERNEEELRRQERFSTIKVKCARHSLADDIRYFGFLARRFPAARFRVDANRRWSADELRAFAGGVDMGRIDYFEEPTPNSLELAGHYPIALDETALEYASRPIAKGWQGGLQRAKAIVVKPHLYVHIHQVLELLQWGVRAGIPMVLSSLFNSSVGTQNLLRLACLYPENTATAHGLGPFCYLAQDTVENPLSARGDCFPREEVAKQLVVREGGR